MQVYREIPTISNQPRERPAELTSLVSVTEAWSVARHREAADRFLFPPSPDNTPNDTAGPPRIVLDAGTGMYLNAILMPIELAPRVGEGVRREALRRTLEEGSGGNVRRLSRQRELEIAGAAERGSVWRDETRFEASILYLRPPRDATDAAIARRSAGILEGGLAEARALRDLARAGTPPTASVLGSIGVRELLEVLETGDETGDGPSVGVLEEAGRRIATRTRRLARRQVRWFDKLARTLHARGLVTVSEGANDPRTRRFVEGLPPEGSPGPPKGHGRMG